MGTSEVDTDQKEEEEEEEEEEKVEANKIEQKYLKLYKIRKQQ